MSVICVILSGMNVIVNGEKRELPPGTTVRGLLEQSGLSPDKVAVELNRRLLPGDKYDTPLSDQDELEIVTFVGGG